jgi:eukaryotic-like serine/threonine-protein kinase
MISTSRYRIIEKIGAGGMGEVYLAEDTTLGRKVAIKFLPPGSTADVQAKKRLVREARSAAQLDHPNICSVYEVSEEDGHSFIVMQYVDGETLARRISNGPLEPGPALDMAIQVVDALAEAHSHGIVHRDIKPQNIMLTTRGQVKVMDFGLARVIRQEFPLETEAKTASLLSEPGMIVGTIPYMSPEQVKGEAVDARSDIFSLGCVLYESVTGKAAFARQSAVETMAAILKDEPPNPAEIGSNITREWNQLMKRCLEKNPNDRFQSASDLALALKAMSAPAGSSTTASPVFKRRIHPATWIGLALFIGLTALVLWQPWRTTRDLQPQQRLISSFAGSHREASFSPDHSLIAFVSDASGVPQVWVKNLAQGDPIQITTGELAARRPRWSPRNDQIVFSSGGSIWSLPPLGGTPNKVIEVGRNPNWSWDGSRLVYEKDDEMWTAKADGSEQQKVDGVPIPDILLADRMPAFSPDGSQIAFFQCSKGPIGDIWVIPSGGGQARQLTFDDHLGGTPVWTSDGRSIVFSSLRGGSRTLWKVPALGGKPEPVLVSPGEDTDPELSRDDTQLIYTNTRNSFVLTVWNPVTNQTRELMEARYDLTDPSFSPKGDKISFFLNENDGGIQVHSIDTIGGNSIPVTRVKGERNIHPRWSPDGLSLYFYQIRPSYSFRKISANGGQSSEIAEGWTWGTHNAAQVDPQGKLIAYVRQEKDRPPTTMIREIETGKETVFKALFRDPQWSKDGKAILGTDLTPGSALALRMISICAVETGVCRQLTRGRLPRWSSDGSRIYLLRESKSGSAKELWSISTEGTNEKMVDVLQFHPIGLSYDVSPKDEIVYVRYQPGKSELWLADFPRL